MERKLTNLIVDQNEHRVLLNGSVKRAKQFEWVGAISRVYSDVKL